MGLTAMKIWSKYGGGENSCRILLSQLRKYSEYKAPYDMTYIDNYDTPELLVVNLPTAKQLYSTISFKVICYYSPSSCM